METLSGEYAHEYYKSMDYEIKSLMRKETHDIVSSKSVGDQNVLTETLSFNYKRKTEWSIRKFK